MGAAKGAVLQAQSMEGFTGSAEIAKPHLGILTRQQHSVRPSPQRCEHGVPGACRRATAVFPVGRDVDVYPRPDLRVRARDAFHSALGLALYVVG